MFAACERVRVLRPSSSSSVLELLQSAGGEISANLSLGTWRETRAAFHPAVPPRVLLEHSVVAGARRLRKEGRGRRRRLILRGDPCAGIFARAAVDSADDSEVRVRLLQGGSSEVR